MVLNEIPFDVREDVGAVGSLVVNRDGTERLIINALAHPTLEYLILFGEETISFRPSTNLLNACMHGYDTNKKGNTIVHGKGISPQYPSINTVLLEKFKQKVKIIPLFWGQNTEDVITEYLNWNGNALPAELKKWIGDKYAKKKIYYDTLVEMIKKLHILPPNSNGHVMLDPRDFQQLQPPIEELNDEEKIESVPFQTSIENNQIVFRMDAGEKHWILRGGDSFLMAYTINKKLNEINQKLSPLHHILIGTELSRAEMELKNNQITERFTIPIVQETTREEISLAPRATLIPDKKFYYKIGLKGEKIQVQSMAHETCDAVFEWRSRTLTPLIRKIASENRFEDYNQSALHRMDVGIETTRAFIALNTHQQFLQDFRIIFSPREDGCPFFIAEGDSFLQVHQNIITKLYTEGVHMPHPDAHKGTMRSGIVLAVFRGAEKALERFPAIYTTGNLSAEDMRKQYAQELSSAENTGAYTYGNRTRAYFNRNQLDETVKNLREHPNMPFVIQRFDYTKDMTVHEELIHNENGLVVRTRLEATHDPCLTHDIYFIQNGKLHAFHIARAHNIVNAYPENVFGLHDAYDKVISRALNIPLGDMFILSNRANILLLTEEQKTKKLMSEPSKPFESADDAAGPFQIGDHFPTQGVAWTIVPIEMKMETPKHPALTVLKNYHGVDLVQKATQYLSKRGATHNNPILGTWDPQNPVVDTAHRLVYFQCNQQGKQLHATAVFLQGKNEFKAGDLELSNYLAAQFSQALSIPTGNLLYITIPAQE